MPTYDFICDDCKHREELTQSFSEPFPSKCPKCSSVLYRQDYSGDRLSNEFSYVEQEATTINQLSERNKKRWGTELSQIKEEKDFGKSKALKKKKEKPWWRDTDKPLDVTKIKDVKKYVETGQK